MEKKIPRHELPSLRDKLRDRRWVWSIVGTIVLTGCVIVVRLSRERDSSSMEFAGRIVAVEGLDEISLGGGGRRGAVGAMAGIGSKNPNPIRVIVEQPDGTLVSWPTDTMTGEYLSLQVNSEIVKKKGEKPAVYRYGKQVRAAGYFLEEDRPRPTAQFGGAAVAVADTGASDAADALMSVDERIRESEALIAEASRRWREGNLEGALESASRCYDLRLEAYGDENHPKVQETRAMIEAAHAVRKN